MWSPPPLATTGATALAASGNSASSVWPVKRRSAVDGTLRAAGYTARRCGGGRVRGEGEGSRGILGTAALGRVRVSWHNSDVGYSVAGVFACTS
eukprot:364466-Chlamydomonas_euryale.AAC.9